MLCLFVSGDGAGRGVGPLGCAARYSVVIISVISSRVILSIVGRIRDLTLMVHVSDPNDLIKSFFLIVSITRTFAWAKRVRSVLYCRR